MELVEHTYFITGGSSGLGAACARNLHAAGARVVILDSNEAAGKELAASLDKSRVDFHRVDITRPDEVSAAMDNAVARFGAMHGAISCAGILGAARIAGRDGPHDLELFRRVVEVNLVGTFNVMRLAVQYMKRNVPNGNGERGVIVNTASVAAFEGQIGQIAYAASKGGVAAMTLPAARDLAADGVRVVAIAPGVFQTPMMNAAPEKVQRALQEQTVFPSRLGQPAEFAMLVRHILENPMLNGCVLRLDGAMRLGPK